MPYADLIKSFKQKYFNKLDIGYRLPSDFSLEKVWTEILEERKKHSETLPLLDEKGNNFWFVNTKTLQAQLHHIDSFGRDSFYKNIHNDIERELMIDSIIEESFSSSLIEGAFTTYKRAQELVKKDITPKNKDELMMKNNYYAMSYIIENRESAFDVDFILKLHEIITSETLSDPNESGKYRDDDVYIRDKSGKLIFKPMPADKVDYYMNSFITWVNNNAEDDFIHPIIKASIIHFYLVYVHPFFDGNGRTARALFYFYLIKNGYDFFKYFSISALIAKDRGKYYRSIQDVENYDDDLTYFLLFSTDIVKKAIGDILKSIVDRYRDRTIFDRIDNMGILLNKRQKKTINIMLKNNTNTITIKLHNKFNKTSYETSRRDLNELVSWGLFKKMKSGKTFVFKFDYKKLLTR
jgi:Fic family protein